MNIILLWSATRSTGRGSRSALEDLLESERQFEEGETVSAAEARERFGTDE